MVAFTERIRKSRGSIAKIESNWGEIISVKGIIIAILVGIALTYFLRPLITKEAGPILPFLDGRSKEQQEIKEVFNKWAKAVLDKDEEEYLSLVDESNQEFYDRQRQFFDGLKGIPFSKFKIAVDTNEGKGFEREKEDKDNNFVVETATTFELKDVEGTIGTTISYFALRKVKDSWKIYSDVSAEMLPDYSPKGLLSIGKLESSSTERFLVLFHPGSEDLANKFLTSSETAFAGIQKELKRELPKSKIPILLCENREEINKALEEEIFPDWAAYLASFQHLGGKGWIIIRKEKIATGPTGIAALSESMGPTIANLAIIKLVSPESPYFFVEGLTSYIGGHSNIETLKEALHKNTALKPSPDDMCQGYTEFESQIKDEETARLAEETSYSIVKYMEHKYGYDKVMSMLDEINSENFTMAANDKEQIEKVDKCFKRVLGVEWAQFKKDWQEYARTL